MTTLPSQLAEHLRVRPSLEQLHARGDVHGPSDVSLWTERFSQFGQRLCVRVAVIAARVALPVWERHEPTLRDPHERIAAAEAWLHCPCEAHAKAAEALAWANGDDFDVDWVSPIVAGGRSITNGAAEHAHYAADWAAAGAAFRGDSKSVREALRRSSCALEDADVNVRVAPPALTYADRTSCVLEEIAHVLTPGPLEWSPEAAQKEAGFLEALRRDPNDGATAAVYADWLEETYRLDAAAALRHRFGKKLDAASLAEMAMRVDPAWWARVVVG